MLKILCGWCPVPKDVDPTEEVSHGICPTHEQELIDQSDARQWMKGNPPSYIGDRRAFDEYTEERKSRKSWW